MNQCAHIDCHLEGRVGTEKKPNGGVLCDAHQGELVLSVDGMCAWTKEKIVAKYGTPVRMKGKNMEEMDGSLDNLGVWKGEIVEE